MASHNIKLSYNGGNYTVIATPVMYGEGENAIPSGNFDLEIQMPDGTVMQSDFYPESDELFSGNIDEGLADLLSTQLLKISHYDISGN